MATPQPGQAVSKSAAVPAAALAAHLGSGGVLQDFLQLARESVATDAGHLSAQISVLDQVWRQASPLSLSVWEVALGLDWHSCFVMTRIGGWFWGCCEEASVEGCLL